METVIGPDAAGRRFDRYLRKLASDVPLSAILRLVRTGGARVNGRKAEPSLRLKAGDRVTLPENLRSAPPRRPPRPRGLRLDVVHEDDAFLVANKPAGIASHQGAGHDSGTLVDCVLSHCLGGRDPVDPTFRPGLVNRLDKGTSGIVLVGKTYPALRELMRQEREREVKKTYLALVKGRPHKVSGGIELPLRRVAWGSGPRLVEVARGKEGQKAVTRWRLLGEASGWSLLAVVPVTGRTHQIRVHLAAMGLPLAGDSAYGVKSPPPAGLARMFLHAWRVELPHPTDGRPVAFVAPLPADLRGVVARLGLDSALAAPEKPT